MHTALGQRSSRLLIFNATQDFCITSVRVRKAMSAHSKCLKDLVVAYALMVDSRHFCIPAGGISQ